MDYKGLFHIALQLISSPAHAWEEIHLEKDKRKVLTAFVYPMIGLCGLLVFITAIWELGWGEAQSYQLAMTRCCALAVSLFGGFFLASYLVDKLYSIYLPKESNLPLAQQFVGYSMVVFFLLKMIITLLPDFTIVAILLMFYTVYIVWEGSDKLMQISDNSRLRFTFISSAIILASPSMIEWGFNKLTELLN